MCELILLQIDVCLSISVQTWTDLHSFSSIFASYQKPVLTSNLTSIHISPPNLALKPSHENVLAKLSCKVTSSPLSKRCNRIGWTWTEGWSICTSCRLILSSVDPDMLVQFNHRCKNIVFFPPCKCLKCRTGQLGKQQQPKQNKTEEEKAQIKYARKGPCADTLPLTHWQRSASPCFFSLSL